MPYIKKTNNTLEVIDVLPPSYNMTSNYHLLDKATHIKDGFFELDSSEPTLSDDEEIASIVENEYEFVESNNTYRKKYIIRKKEVVEESINTEEQTANISMSSEKIILNERYRRLAACDWVELPSTIARMDKDMHDRWLEYRQNLRDCVKNVNDPKDVVWPVAPFAPRLGSKYPHYNPNPYNNDDL